MIKNRHPSFWWPILLFGIIILPLLISVSVYLIKEHFNWFTLIWVIVVIFVSAHFVNIFTSIEKIEFSKDYLTLTRGPFGFGKKQLFKKADILKIGIIEEKMFLGIKRDEIQLTQSDKTILIGKYITEESAKKIMLQIKEFKYPT